MNYVPYFIGLILGIVFALLPGMHTNTIISMLSSFGLEKEFMAFLIVGLYPAHLIFSFVSSIFMRVPDENNALASTCAQNLITKGRGILALKTAILSCVFSGIFSAILFPTAVTFFPSVYSALQANIKFLLLIFSIVLIFRSKSKFLAFIVFICAGFIGQVSFSLDLTDPFLPLFGGFFAVASALSNSKFNKNTEEKEKPNPSSSDSIHNQSEPLKNSQLKNILAFSFFGVILGFFADLFPGVGAPSQIASFVSIIVPFSSLTYLSLTSSLSISQFVFSLASKISIDKARVGATEWLSKFIKIDQNSFLLLLLIVLSLVVSAFLLFLLSKKFVKFADIDFSKFSIFIIFYLFILVFLLDGIFGIFIMLFSSALGYMAIKNDVERTHLMGAIIIPTLLLLFRIFI